MFKKIASAAVAALMLVSLFALSVSADAMNPADGCKTVFTFKKAAEGAVVHDGVISEGEYTEIEINRDVDTTDLLLSWDGPSDSFVKACDFLNNVHFYASWDETNGINLAGQATLFEEPYCEGKDPVGTPEVPQDEHFMFQFGFMVKLENTEDVNVEKLYYSIGMNTVTGELLIGNYGRIGYVPCYPVAEKDYNVRIDGHTVTYEISFPASAILPEESLSGGHPAVGAQIPLSLTLTGGSKGFNHNGNATYAVSVGDNGFMTSRRNIGSVSPAWGTVSADPVVESGGAGNPDETSQETGAETTVADPTVLPETTAAPTDAGKTENPAAAGSVKPSDTGDPMIVLAAVASISAAGAFIVRKKRR